MRKEVAFLLKFGGLLALFFLLAAPKPMNDLFVEPFTAVVAKAGGLAARLFGEKTVMVGTTISSPRFSVNIRNGCNGLETIFIFAAGKWSTAGKAVFNLNPDEAVRHFHTQYEKLDG